MTVGVQVSFPYRSPPPSWSPAFCQCGAGSWWNPIRRRRDVLDLRPPRGHARGLPQPLTGPDRRSRLGGAGCRAGQDPPAVGLHHGPHRLRPARVSGHGDAGAAGGAAAQRHRRARPSRGAAPARRAGPADRRPAHRDRESRRAHGPPGDGRGPVRPADLGPAGGARRRRGSMAVGPRVPRRARGPAGPGPRARRAEGRRRSA